jgi:hypothetical protein
MAVRSVSRVVVEGLGDFVLCFLRTGFWLRVLVWCVDYVSHVLF